TIVISVDSDKVKNGSQVSPASNAQKIAELRSQIDTEEKQLEQLRLKLKEQEKPESKFALGEQKFQNLDTKVKELKARVDDLKSQDQIDVELLAEVQHELEETSAKRADALKAFELEIVENKTTQEKILIIQKKIEADRHLLDRLSNPEQPVASLPTTELTGPPAPNGLQNSVAPATQPKGQVSSKSAETAKSTQPSLSQAITSTATGGILAKKSGTEPDRTETKAPAAAEEAEKTLPKSLIAVHVQDKIEELQNQIVELNNQLEVARQDEAIAAEQVANLDKQVNLEAKLRDNARQKSDLANELVAKKQDEFREKSLSEAPQDILKEIANRLLELQKEFQTARDESRLHSNRLQTIQNERSKQQDALRLAREKTLQLQKQIAEAQAEIANLKDPTSILNILDWLTTRGVRIILLLLTMIGSRVALRSLGSRTIRMMVRSQSKTHDEEHNDRAETLVSVYSNAVSVSVIGGGLLLIAQEAGVPIGPLLGGAAIFGVAIAFGAQSLVKDYFYGFVILLENQFSVNDVIQVGAITGVVERITLRMTVIRDVAGTVHFMPNGSMTMVSNYSYDWSRAVFEIPISYKANIDEVIDIIHAEGKKLRQDREFGPLCLEELTMLGVDGLNETSIMIKFYIKTKPLKQWPVKRELLRRIKNRFDLMGIENPTTAKAVLAAMIRADTGDENGGPNMKMNEIHSLNK
ncbi:MAG: putative MscS family protein YkuT, partial [Planctomycetota bacterium]